MLNVMFVCALCVANRGDNKIWTLANEIYVVAFVYIVVYDCVMTLTLNWCAYLCYTYHNNNNNHRGTHEARPDETRRVFSYIVCGYAFGCVGVFGAYYMTV